MILPSVIIIMVIAVVLMIKGKQIFYGNEKPGAVKPCLQAEAIILSIQQTGIFFNNMLQVKLQMQVLPDKGRNFITENTQLLSVADMAAIGQGTRIIVRYDPGNLKEIILLRIMNYKNDDSAMAILSGLPTSTNRSPV